MYNGVGLLTPRGSGTSGHVQSNQFNFRRAPPSADQFKRGKKVQEVKNPNEEILEHNRKREIEVKLLEMKESLEEQGYSEEDIVQELESLRVEMIQAVQQQSKPSEADLAEETHAIAARKKAQMHKLQDAFGLGELREGEAFNQELKEQKRQERLQQIEEQKTKEKQEKKEQRRKLRKIKKEKERLKKQLRKEKKEILRKQRALKSRAEQRKSRSQSSLASSSSSSGESSSSSHTSSSDDSVRDGRARNQQREIEHRQLDQQFQCSQSRGKDDVGGRSNKHLNQHVQEVRDGGRKRERHYSDDSNSRLEREGREIRRPKIDSIEQEQRRSGRNDIAETRSSLEQSSGGQRKSRFDQMERPVNGSKAHTLKSKVVANQDNYCTYMNIHDMHDIYIQHDYEHLVTQYQDQGNQDQHKHAYKTGQEQK